MRILLDECITKRLKPHLKPHDVATVHEMGWSGIKNGKLLSLCVEHKFDILLSIDKNLQYQQNLIKHPVDLFIFQAHSADIDELMKFVPDFLARISSYEKHQVHCITV